MGADEGMALDGVQRSHLGDAHGAGLFYAWFVLAFWSVLAIPASLSTAFSHF
jgi:hypothetical protein